MLDINGDNLRLGLLVEEKSTQKFEKMETDHEYSNCPAPETMNPHFLTSPPSCKKGFVFDYGRCRKVFRG